MLAVTRVRPGIPALARPQLRCFSATGRSSAPSELETVLRSQDPYDRIQFYPNVTMPPSRDSHLARVDFLQDQLRQYRCTVKNAVPNLLPCWTVVLYSNASWYIKDMKNGRRNRWFVTKQIDTAQAFTIAAVPRGHWAQGAVLPSDPLRWLPEPSNPSSAASFVGSKSYLYPHYDSELAPKFAYGPPKLNRLQMEDIVCRQQLYWEHEAKGLMEHKGDNDQEVLNLLGDITMFATPHYRLVYHVETDSVDFLYDASETLSEIVPLGEVPGSLGRKPESYFLDLEELFRPMLHRMGVGTDKKEMRLYGGIKPSESVAQEATMVRALMDNPIGPQSWEDEYILPLVSSTGGNDFRSAIKFAGDFLWKQAAAEPVFEKIKKKAPGISEHLRRRAASAAASAASASSQPRAHRRRAETPRFTATREHVDERNRVMQQRLKSEIDRQRAWQNTGNWKEPTMPERVSQNIGAAAFEELQFKAGRPQPAMHKIISDPRSYYKRLGIQPAPRYLQYYHERTVDAEIKDKYRELTLENHPDRAKSPEDEARLHHIMANINVAKENLETAEKRIAYHNKFSPTKLGR